MCGVIRQLLQIEVEDKMIFLQIQINLNISGAIIFGHYLFFINQGRYFKSVCMLGWMDTRYTKMI